MLTRAEAATRQQGQTRVEHGVVAAVDRISKSSGLVFGGRGVERHGRLLQTVAHQCGLLVRHRLLPSASAARTRGETRSAVARSSSSEKTLAEISRPQFSVAA